MEDILKDVVVFGAAWCATCKVVKKMLEDQGTEFTYIDVDTGAGAALAKDWSVRGLPQGYHNGQLVFGTVTQARNFLKRHGAEVAPVVNENIAGLQALMQEGERYAIVDELQQPELAPERVRQFFFGDPDLDMLAQPQEAIRVRI